MIDDNNVELKWFVTHYKGGQKSEPVLMQRFRNVYIDNSYVGQKVKPRWGEWKAVPTETVLENQGEFVKHPQLIKGNTMNEEIHDSPEEYRASFDKSFEEDLVSLLNIKCREGESNTPDFILAEYMIDCLKAFNKAVNKREEWHGRVNASPSRYGVSIQKRELELLDEVIDDCDELEDDGKIGAYGLMLALNDIRQRILSEDEL